MAHLEDAVTAAGGIVLRYGVFYGAENDGLIVPVRKRQFPIIGDGGGMISWIHLDDAAAATVIALEHEGPEHLRDRRRRAGPGARVAAGARGVAGRQAAAALPALAGAPGRRRGGGDAGNRGARRLEREGQARAGLGAAVRELAPGIPRRVCVGRVHRRARGQAGREDRSTHLRDVHNATPLPCQLADGLGGVGTPTPPRFPFVSSSGRAGRDCGGWRRCRRRRGSRPGGPRRRRSRRRPSRSRSARRGGRRARHVRGRRGICTARGADHPKRGVCGRLVLGGCGRRCDADPRRIHRTRVRRGNEDRVDHHQRGDRGRWCESRHLVPPCGDEVCDARDATVRSPFAHRERSPDWGARLPILRCDAELGGPGARLAAIADVELSKDRRDVVIDRLSGQEQALGDFGVAKPPCHEPQDLHLPIREAGGIAPRRGSWPARQPARPTLAKADARRSRPPERLRAAEAPHARGEARPARPSPIARGRPRRRSRARSTVPRRRPRPRPARARTAAPARPGHRRPIPHAGASRRAPRRSTAPGAPPQAQAPTLTHRRRARDPLPARPPRPGPRRRARCAEAPPWARRARGPRPAAARPRARPFAHAPAPARTARRAEERARREDPRSPRSRSERPPASVPGRAPGERGRRRGTAATAPGRARRNSQARSRGAGLRARSREFEAATTRGSDELALHAPRGPPRARARRPAPRARRPRGPRPDRR